MPFFSIIVVSLNAEKFIRSTIDSILSQTFDDYEIIVKDALSQDATLEQIPRDERIVAYSCADSGIYSGMNQAIMYSTGRYLCFLNCGDLFYDNNVLMNMFNVINQQNDAENTFFYGNYETKGVFTQSPKVTTRASIYRNPLCHQTMFIPRNLFERLGYYREDFRILADYDFTVHAVNEKISFNNTGIVVCKYLGNGISTQNKYRKIMNNECKIVRKTYFTKIERLIFNINIMVTLPRLRIFLASDKSPRFLNRWYRKIANNAKMKGK